MTNFKQLKTTMNPLIFTFFFVVWGLNSFGQPTQAFFVVHCDPNEAYNFPNLEILVDSANNYNVKLTIEFTSYWVDSIMPYPARLNKIATWKSQGHEIGMHHHEVTAFGIWDGYSNLSMIEIYNAGRDTNNYKGNVDSLYNFVQQITSSPIKTIGVEDSLEMPSQALYQTKGFSITHGFSNPFSYMCNGISYCKTSHCFINDLFKEQQLEANYPSMSNYTILGANCHVYNFVSDPLPIVSYFQFLNENGIASKTVENILQESCPNNGIENIISSDNIILSPNPFSVQSNLQINGSLENASVVLYNQFGQAVKQITNITGQSVIIQRDNLPSGLYFVRLVENNKVIITKKIVIN